MHLGSVAHAAKHVTLLPVICHNMLVVAFLSLSEEILKNVVSRYSEKININKIGIVFYIALLFLWNCPQWVFVQPFPLIFFIFYEIQNNQLYIKIIILLQENGK